MLKNIEVISKTPAKDPKYIKPIMVEYKRSGDKDTLTWEMVEAHNSIHIMIDNTQTKELLFVKQVRIPVLINNPETDGKVVETCAGLIDKNKSIIQIAKEEVLEEMGYDIPLGNIVPLRRLMSSVGTKGGYTECFTATVDESMKVSAGGGLKDEDIEVVRIPYNDALEFVYAKGKYSEVMTDSTTVFLIMDWFVNNNKN